MQDVSKAKAYFDKIKGKRCGVFVSELKKQYVLHLVSLGAKRKHIEKIVGVDHIQVWHYINRMKDNPECEDIVKENMFDWIDKGLYPLSGRETGKANVQLFLHEYPMYKDVKKSSKRREIDKWDKLIEDL